MDVSYARFVFVAPLAALILCLVSSACDAKDSGVYFPPELVTRLRANVKSDPWAQDQKRRIVESARPWLQMSDDQLWGLMFGNTLKRSWMVWSDGYCASCKRPVPMYTWKINALQHPWKVQCPHCKEFFPKNDFYKFYLSGLDEHGIFDPKLADRSLLYNLEHPDPKDPLHSFGVDDGDGYAEGEKRWRFIGAYLIYGQWKQVVLGGIRSLASAYVVTGDRRYAHKAAIMLDRVADLYPTFDFAREGVMYDGRNVSDGYVSTWHDACEETRELAMAYDMIFDGIRDDASLIRFLSGKAKQYKLDNPKSSFSDIQRNIEDRILRDALANTHKIHSNYPRTEIAKIVIMQVLDWPKNKDEVMAVLDSMMTKATAVDGVTGEKGLAGYSAFTIQSVAGLIEQMSRLDRGFLKDLIRRYPRIHDMFRFHIDTWCMQEYYPQVGDTGDFARKSPNYVGVVFSRDPASGSIWTFALTPSMFSFLWRLYEVTGDTAFVQVLYHANSDSVQNLPYDLFCEDPAAFQRNVRNVIARVGPTLKLGSVNKEEWHIAILRSGEGGNARAAWLQYDSMGSHGHANCMHLGLFAKGLDLLPDFGYKPVQYGGWGSPRANWYGMSAAHNTVVIDGRDHAPGAGKTTLWANGRAFRAIRVSAPQPAIAEQFDRTVAMIDTSDSDSYLLDIFRVVGGSDHAKFLGSHFGTITPSGLSLLPSEDYGYGTQMRNFVGDPNPEPGWSVDWKIEDKYRYLPPNSDVHLRYTDLTFGAGAYVAEAWVALRGVNSAEDAWVPRIMVRRRSDTPGLRSAFVGIIEPYANSPIIKRVERIPVHDADGKPYDDFTVGVQVTLSDGRRDVILSSQESQMSRQMVQESLGVSTDARLCHVRTDASGSVTSIALCKGTFIRVGDLSLRLTGLQNFVELAFAGNAATVVTGRPEYVSELLLRGSVLPVMKAGN